MWNLRNEIDEHRVRKKRERETIKQALNYEEQTEDFWRGGGFRERAKWVIGDKEGNCFGEPGVLYVNESLNSISETNITPCIY